MSRLSPIFVPPPHLSMWTRYRGQINPVSALLSSTNRDPGTQGPTTEISKGLRGGRQGQASNVVHARSRLSPHPVVVAAVRRPQRLQDLPHFGHRQGWGPSRPGFHAPLGAFAGLCPLVADQEQLPVLFQCSP
jgi:hypothetical protein